MDLKTLEAERDAQANTGMPLGIEPEAKISMSRFKTDTTRCAESEQHVFIQHIRQKY